MKSSAPSSGPWRGLYGGTANALFVGAWVVDQATGRRGQITAILEDGWVELRMDNGEVVRVRIRPA